MRVKCPRCQRPEGHCFCNGLQPELAGTDMLILQHPDEARHALNTARIAELGLSNCKILVGEDFANNTVLKTALAEKTACLLFPAPGSKALQSNLSNHIKPELCIVIDGTWRKARKIFYCNPFLNTLPAITLEPDNASHYRIRKAPSKKSLATVEAIVTFLRQTEGDNTIHQPLLDAFTKLIDQQIEAMGKTVYQNNYAQKFCL